MKKIAFGVFIAFLLTNITKAQLVDSLYEVATWQGFRSCAVTFTFDDNTPNQISVVLPIFDQYGYKMTFFPVVNWGPNWSALQAAALNGHEVGSHTVSHANLGSLTDQQQDTEFKNSQETIDSHVTAQKCLTIAYPYCALGNSLLCDQYYIAARGCSGVIVSKTPSDFMNISSIVCGSQGSIQRSNDFINKANSAALSHGWAVFLIHAIDSESGYSPTSSTELNSTLDHFSKNDDKYWISTFGNVAKYIKERNSVSVRQVAEGDTVITFSVTDTLDNSIYNYPVTIRRMLPESWLSAKIMYNDRILTSQIVSINEKNYLMFDVVPDSGDITIIKDEVTAISEFDNRNISSPYLLQNYPNPFNPVTTINFRITEYGFVTLKVYDLLGSEVATLVNENRLPGNYSVQFDGNKLAGGLYIYKLKTNNYLGVRKLLLLK